MRSGHRLTPAKWAAVAATIAAVAYGIFVFRLWSARQHDVSRFIVLSSESVDPRSVPPGVTVQNVGGYDGTAFYRLALDPFTRSRTAFGISLDVPAYRQQRIGYPLLVWSLSFGRPAAVPWMLVIVNVGAVTALAGLGALLATGLAQHPLWGLLLAFYPGFVYSVSRDLCEPLACAFAVSALLAIVRKRYGTASVLLSAAILTRETFVMLAIAWGIQWLWSRRAIVVFALPVAVFVIWQAILKLNWGTIALRAAAPRFTVPFTQYWHALAESSSLRHAHRMHFFELVFLLIIAVLTLISLRNTAPLWAIAWVGYAGLAAILPAAVWSEDVAYMRVLGDFYIVSSAIVVPSTRPRRWIAAVATAIVWYYLASHLVEYS
ncbi:MAG TPA: hypothetical protein VGJ81_08195 [Thermoanaerobaculia bacterium]|jgi:hypothetical protein